MIYRQLQGYNFLTKVHSSKIGLIYKYNKKLIEKWLERDQGIVKIGGTPGSKPHHPGWETIIQGILYHFKSKTNFKNIGTNYATSGPPT